LRFQISFQIVPSITSKKTHNNSFKPTPFRRGLIQAFGHSRGSYEVERSDALLAQSLGKNPEDY